MRIAVLALAGCLSCLHPAAAQDTSGETGNAAAAACADAVSISQENSFSIRIAVTNPCRAGAIIRFEHNGQSLSRFADDAGTVSILRLLADGDNQVSLLTDDGPKLLFDNGVVATAGDPAGAPGAAQTPAGNPGEAVAAETVVPEPAIAEPPAEAPVTVACALPAIEHRFDGPLLTVELTQQCAAPRPIRLDYRERGWRFYGTLTADDPMTVQFVPVDDSVTLDLAIEGGGYHSLTLPVPDTAQQPALAILFWQAPVDLDLVAREPGGNAPLGTMLLADAGDHSGSKFEVYALDPDKAKAAFGARPVIGLGVVNASRNQALSGALNGAEAQEHCGTGQYAAIDYQLLWRAQERWRERRFKLAAIGCDQPPPAAPIAAGDLRVR